MKNGEKGTGFFCKIPFPDKDELLPVLITTNHIINESYLAQEESITISLYKNYFGNETIKKIDLSQKKTYTNTQQDITIIEIKENQEEIDSFLNIDPNLMTENCEDIYVKNSLYIIGYPNAEDVKVSYGILKSKLLKNKFDFSHSCSTEEGSSGSPIFNLATNKVIGVHKQAGKHNYNKGSFLNVAIRAFISKKCNNNNINDNTNDTLNNENILYNGYIFDYSKKYIEEMDEDESFYPTILIENHSSKCRGSLLLYNEQKIIKTRKYPIKVFSRDENNVLGFNWDDVESTYDKIFKDLKVDPSKHNIVISDSLNNYKENREKMAQILFDTFQIKGLFFIRKPILSYFFCFFSNDQSGIVINIGKYETNITLIFEYTILPTVCWKLKMDGNNIKNNMNDESISNLLAVIIAEKTIGIIKELDIEIREEVS